MGSISCHIMPLVINSLGAGTHTYTDVCTETILRNQEHTGRAPGLKRFIVLSVFPPSMEVAGVNR